MVVETQHAVVADGAVRGARGTEDLAREAVFQLHGLEKKKEKVYNTSSEDGVYSVK